MKNSSSDSVNVRVYKRFGLSVRVTAHKPKEAPIWYSAFVSLPERGVYLSAAGATEAAAVSRLAGELRLRREALGLPDETHPLPEELEMERRQRIRADKESFRRTVMEGHCPFCGGRKKMDSRRDAYFCPRCDEWLEEACGDVRCAFCRGRAAHPSLDRRFRRNSCVSVRTKGGSQREAAR